MNLESESSVPLRAQIQEWITTPHPNPDPPYQNCLPKPKSNFTSPKHAQQRQLTLNLLPWRIQKARLLTSIQALSFKVFLSPSIARIGWSWRMIAATAAGQWITYGLGMGSWFGLFVGNKGMRFYSKKVMVLNASNVRLKRVGRLEMELSWPKPFCLSQTDLCSYTKIWKCKIKHQWY